MNFRQLSNILTIHVPVRVTTRTCASIKIFIDDVIMSFVISLIGDQFSPRFWYVVAETILYKSNDINLSIFWRHHSRLKATMHNFSYLRVMSMGGHLFFQTWICMAMIFEPYLGCSGSIFSHNLVCCSWDYGLSATWSSILNQMSGTWSNYRFKIWEMSEAYHLNLSAWQITSS